MPRELREHGTQGAGWSSTPRRKGKGSVVVKGTDGAGNSSALPASWCREHAANNEGDCLVRLQSEQEREGQPPEQEITARQGRTPTTGRFTEPGREGCRCFAASHRQGRRRLASKPIAWKEGEKKQTKLIKQQDQGQCS